MKKKRIRKLVLHRETLRNLSSDQLGPVVGAARSEGSERCTEHCSGIDCTIGDSFCVCPKCVPDLSFGGCGSLTCQTCPSGAQTACTCQC